MHQEAEELKTSHTHARHVFEVDVHPQPSFQRFSDYMRSARERNARILHFAGHGKSHFLQILESAKFVAAQRLQAFFLASC